MVRPTLEFDQYTGFQSLQQVGGLHDFGDIRVLVKVIWVTCGYIFLRVGEESMLIGYFRAYFSVKWILFTAQIQQLIIVLQNTNDKPHTAIKRMVGHGALTSVVPVDDLVKDFGSRLVWGNQVQLVWVVLRWLEIICPAIRTEWMWTHVSKRFGTCGKMLTVQNSAECLQTNHKPTWCLHPTGCL